MIREKIDIFRRKLHGLTNAYVRVFDKKSPFTEIVLKDLARFCRANETTFLPDARAHAVLEGRKEVWLRIQNHLNLTIEELYKLHTIKEIMPRETD